MQYSLIAKLPSLLLLSLAPIAVAQIVQTVTNPPTIALTGTVRDFNGNLPGGRKNYQVETQLDADKNPVNKSADEQANFAQWYKDVSGVNLSRLHPIVLTDPEQDGTFEYKGLQLEPRNVAFYPVDGQFFGDDEQSGHNLGFTYELHAKFTFRGDGKETLRIVSDDDSWVFINGRLAIDQSGVHPAQGKEIAFDANKASELGLEPGKVYDLDLFHAEQNYLGGALQIATSLSLESDVTQPGSCTTEVNQGRQGYIAPTTETLVVPFEGGSKAATTVHEYAGIVEVTVWGAGQSAGFQLSDAFYIYRNEQGRVVSPVEAREFGLFINGNPAQAFFTSSQRLPEYTPYHSYCFRMSAPQGKLTFGVGDASTDDNREAFIVTVKQVL